jgi:NAD(P)-dependent dehydrogenase (short-subunit alcohol dehydrogenase family)
MMMNRTSRFTGEGSSRSEAYNDGMRIFLAGASGVIGQRLIPRLVQAGHVVGGMTRSPGKTELLSHLGAEPILCDVFDREALIQAVRDFKPDIILNELTDLPDDVAKIGEHAGLNARIRTEGNQNLIEAARQSRSPKLLAQSVAWQLPDGPDARAVAELERSVLAEGGVVLRYGMFYGPGTYNEQQPPKEPRVHINRAAERTVEALGEPTGVVVISEQLMTSSKPMFVLAFLIISTLITTSTLMAQKAVTPPMAQETITAHVERSGRISRQRSSDVHRRLSAGLFEPCPPPQCAGVCLRVGGLRRDAGERGKRSHAAARPELL